ncbi:MAG: transcriptional repressor [bacterium]
MADAKPSADERFARFKDHLRVQRLKSTAQRDTIVRAFLESQRHISVEELYNEVRRRNPRIGYATVYRTMKLLTESGVAAVRHFRDGEARYESAEKRHHDHMICESCGKIVEFEEARIEALQEEIAKRLGFQFTGHKMELYGICRDCRRTRQQHAAG